MTQSEFLNTLKDKLRSLPQSEVHEILRDQEEYFKEAKASGRSESEIISKLGGPESFAAGLIAEAHFGLIQRSPTFREKVTHFSKAIVTILFVGPLQTIVFGVPFLVGLTLLSVLWITASLCSLGSFATLVTWVIKLPQNDLGFWHGLSAMFFILGCLGASALFFSATYSLSSLFFSKCINYFRRAI